MTNHISDPDSSAKLADAWRNLPEHLRKQIFKAVYRKFPAFMIAITKDIKGFTAKGLLKRPLSLVPRLDNLLITFEGGKELRRLIQNYFTICNPTINDNFLINFRRVGNVSPEMSSNQITEKVLEILYSEFKDDQLWDLYKMALPACAPRLFSDDPPDPEDLSPDDETTSHTSSNDSITLVNSLQQVSNLKDQQSVLPKVKLVVSQSLKPSDNHDQEIRLPESGPQKYQLPKKPHEEITEANIGEVIELLSHKLKAMTVAELEKNLQLHQKTISSLTNDYEEYSARQRELDQKLTNVQKLGLINDDTPHEAFFAPIHQLPITDATDRLVLGISQVTAILDKHKRLAELEETLNIGPISGLCCLDDKPDLGQILALVDRRLSELEKLFHEYSHSEALLLDFVERIESCDFITVRQLVAESTPEIWENLIRATLLFYACSEETDNKMNNGKKSVHIATKILQDPLLITLILSVIWQVSPLVGIRILNLLTENRDTKNSRILGLALAGLMFNQLQIVAGESPHLAKEISRLTLISALAYHNLESIRWLQSLFRFETSATIAEVEFLRECVISQERGCLVQDMSAALGLIVETQRPDSCRNNMAKELQKLSEVQGFGGNYWKLRELTRERYIIPVMYHVHKNQADIALQLWAGYGDYESMTNHVIKDIDSIHKPEERHLNKTIQYLRTFGETLARWAEPLLQQKNGPTDVFMSAFRNFKRMSGESEKALLITLTTVLTDNCTDVVPPEYFGRIAETEGMVARKYVNPQLIESWIMACNSPSEETEVVNVLGELLTHMFGETSVSLSPQDILGQLLCRSEFMAAASLTSLYPDIKTIFSEYIAEAHKITLSEYESIWEAAHTTAKDDTNVQLWTSEIEHLMDEYRFSEAHSYLPDLKEAIHQHDSRQSKEYKTEADILREAGWVIPDGYSLHDLHKDVQLLKKETFLERQHISCLEHVLTSSNYDNSFKEEVKNLLSEIDRPVRWLPPAESKIMSEYLLIILRYLESRIRWRDSRPEIYNRLSSSLALFITKSVEVLTSPTTAHHPNSELADLATGIEVESWETDEVLRYLNDYVQPIEDLTIKTEDGSAQFLAHKSPGSISHPMTMPMPRGIHQANDEIAKEVLAKLRRTIFRIVEREEKVELPQDKHTALRTLCQEKKWLDARILSASILLHGTKDDESRKIIESIYCIARACESGRTRLALEEIAAVCLGTILPMLSSQTASLNYYIDRSTFKESVVRAFLRGLKHWRDLSLNTMELKAELSADLNALVEKSISDDASRWVLSLLNEARLLVLPGNQKDGATILVTQLWEQLTGASDPARSRAKLLLLCFHLNLIDDVIANLAKNDASPYDHSIIQFLRAVRLSEANETAWNDAHRLAQSFIEQVPANKMKPWRIMVDTLNRSRKIEPSQERCSITLENCSRIDSNTFLLELYILPGAYTILETAQLSIGDDTSDGYIQQQTVNLINEGDQITSGKILRIKVKLTPSAKLDNEVVFPYCLDARTTAGNKIDQRDRWTFTLSKTEQPQIPAHIILNLWKGADGNPVDSKLKAYHGRKNESARLQQLLAGQDERQGSALVIGQRRIGKTSLLIETLRSYPPSEGHVCAVFSQFGGIQKRTPTEPLGQTVFNAITELSDVTSYNKEFCQLLSKKLGDTWLRTLRSGLNPSTSIAAALTTFVDRVNKATNGLIKRMAFFADEFQDVFKYPIEEVDQVMWGLRPLVQMSPTISLVFAGSGMTKELIRSYDKAFFGSIATVPLRSFSLDSDSKAIADTFLPEDARKYLCPNLNDLNSVVREAYQLTDGHPWYLSMLGRSAASLSQGRFLTPILLKEVAQKMVAGHSEFQDKEIGASRFYGHLFDSLDSAGKQKAHAQLVLANIARQVTLEWPWLTATQAISGPKIDQMQCSSRDCLDALRKLKDEEVLVHKIDGVVPKYRIRIPLVAEAVRYDADDIEYQAAEMLL